jgi:TolB-like protein/DNA-binding winged helix-turn-helix (wHTH) protein/Tfp pilus assembly protein PilF
VSIMREAMYYEFGPFRLDVSEKLLLRDGQAMPLAPKVFDTLVVLVEGNGHLIAKDELMKQLWPDTFVEEATLARNISDLRKALGESPSGQKYIETVPKRGYRFIAVVRQTKSAAAALVVERHTRSHIIAEQETLAQIEAEPSVGERLFAPKRWPIAGFRLGTRLAVGLVAALSVSILLFVLFKASGVRTLNSIKSIAVLPFKSIDIGENDRYLEVGMADSLINRLSRIRHIVVRPTSTITRYNQPEQNAMAAARELDVDSVIEGHLQRSGDRVRVSVQLISAEDGATLWAEKFDLKWTDIFVIQDSISDQIIQALSLELSGEEKKRLARRHTENTEAHQAYMKGRFWWSKRTQEGFQKAVDFFNESIALDHNYALSYAGLADCYAMMSPYNLLTPKEVYPKAKAAATQALALDDQLAEAHASLALISYLYDWDFRGAEIEFKRAIELDPNYPDAHQWYSTYLSSMARHEEAIAEARRAHELDPLSLNIIQELVRTAYHAHRYDEAIAAGQKTLELNPDYYKANSFLELAYWQSGLYDQAIELRLKAMSAVGFDAATIASLREAYAASGWRGFWQKELARALARAPRRPTMYYVTARMYARLGEHDRAMEWLEKAYAERADHLVMLKVDPIFDRLRDDPRYQDLMRRVGFP